MLLERAPAIADFNQKNETVSLTAVADLMHEAGQALLGKTLPGVFQDLEVEMSKVIPKVLNKRKSFACFVCLMWRS